MGDMPSAGCRCATRRGCTVGTIATLAAVLAMALSLILPGAALATYADYEEDGVGGVTDFDLFDSEAASAASQMGGTIYGDQIPDGTYTLPVSNSVYFSNGSNNAFTSSTMCYLKSCTIMVSGGSITATFTLSSAYTAIYLGDAESAAAASGADGTDTSSYLMGDYDSSTGCYSYTISVPSLNTAMTIAAYNGGTKGDEGNWWTRKVIFVATDEILEAISDKAEQEEAGDEGSTDSSTDGGSDSSSSSGDGSGDGEGADGGDVSAGSEQSDGSGTGSGTGSGSGSGSGSGTGSGDGAGSADASGSGELSEATAAGEHASGDVIGQTGFAISIPGSGGSGGGDGGDSGAVVAETEAVDDEPAQWVYWLMVVGGLLLVGAALQGLTYIYRVGEARDLDAL